MTHRGQRCIGEETKPTGNKGETVSLKRAWDHSRKQVKRRGKTCGPNCPSNGLVISGEREVLGGIELQKKEALYRLKERQGKKRTKRWVMSLGTRTPRKDS